MNPFHARLAGAAVALTLAAGSPALSQQLELKLMAPAAPGGGWDQTARAMQQAFIAAGIARSVQVTNVAGAGGSVGIAQFVNGAKGDGNQLMVNGFVRRTRRSRRRRIWPQRSRPISPRSPLPAARPAASTM
jgi:putative tricarboxylic transport membrane protein